MTGFLPSPRTLDYLPAPEDCLVLRISARDRDLAQQVPGLKFHKADETWRGAPLLSTGLALRGVFGNDLDVTDAVYERLAAETERASAVLAVKNGEQHPAENDPAVDGLFPPQKDAAWCAALQTGFLIADEKGAGKTVEAAGALNIAAAGGPGGGAGTAYPALVVSTNSMKYGWAEEIEKWCKVPVVVAGRTPTLRKSAIEKVRTGEAMVLVMSWEQLRLHSSLAPYGSVARSDAEKEPKELNAVPFKTVIADEAHRCKNPKTKTTRALWAVGHGPSVVNRWALSATPITGNTVDLWGPLHFIRPDMFPSRSKFIDRYVRVFTNVWGGVEDLGLRPDTEPEFRKILDPLFIRRPLRIDARLLPVQHRFVDMEGRQLSTYRKFEKDSIAKIDGKYLVAVGSLVVNTRLQQLAQATPVLEDVPDPETGEPRTQVTALKLPSCKYDALCDLLDEMGGEPLVVFSDSRKLLELCYRELTTPKGRTPARFRPEQVGLITGKVSSQDRHAAITAFQEGSNPDGSPTMPLIMCTIGAGSEGITLTRASTMCFLNRSYREVGNNQAEGRLYRHGQDRDVQIIDIITRDSEELRVYEATARKADRMQDIVQDDNFERRELPQDGERP